MSDSSGDFSFFWHDYETFGRVPRRDRPAQFAGLRTDAERLEAINRVPGEGESRSITISRAFPESSSAGVGSGSIAGWRKKRNSMPA